ncbi:MAG: ATP-binding protein [Mycobacterium leprae]
MTRHRLGLGARLFAAQLLVVAAGTLTVSIVAATVGPPIFHVHLHRAVSGEVPASVLDHAEMAFRTASVLSMTVAVAASLAAALAISALATRRLSSRVRALAAAAGHIAEGNYGVRVPPTELGEEFDALTTSFNALAARLADTETMRRRLLADLAHEMRTPLATLEAYTEGLADGVIAADDVAAEVVRGQTGRLRRLIEDIAAVSRAEEHQLDLHPTPTNPAVLLDAATLAAADRYAAKNVRLVTDAAPNLPDVTVDVDRLGQVLGNLLDNALRHTPAGGGVTACVRGVGEFVEIGVQDTGEGITPEHLPHVFERFYRADAARDRASGGSGIGLAISHAIVQAHGGSIRADSPGRGAGASFTIVLPVDNPRRPVTGPAPTSSRQVQ